MNEKQSPAMLVVLTGTETGRTYPITGSLTIGRTNGNDIIVSDPSVSRRHARIEPLDDGFALTDLGSRNKIAAKGETSSTHKLSVGDEFTLGSVRLKILPPAKREAPPVHAIVPSPPKVPVAIEQNANAAELFEAAAKPKKGSRKLIIALGLILLIILAVPALSPFFKADAVVTRLDVVVDEGMTKAVGVWNTRARISRQSPIRIMNPRIAGVKVDTGDGFIIKVTGKSRGVTEASGTNKSGGTTIINVVVNPLADEIWVEQTKPDAEKKRSALYRIGRARDIESHSAYEAMKEYRVAALILKQIDPRPKEYSEAVFNEKRIREEIDKQMEEHIKTYLLAVKAERYGSAGIELRSIAKLIPDGDDYRNQKARILYVRLTKLRSRKEKK